jgi:Cu-Zn family superoxide dismutase
MFRIINKMCSNAIAIFNTPGVKGSITFHQCSDENETLVFFNLSGMKPGKMRACHIHEYGDESQGCKSLGAHWNPLHSEHGYCYLSIGENTPSIFDSITNDHLEGFGDSHAGDLLNNIQPDEEGKFKYVYYDPRIQIQGDVSQSIVGRSVVIHEGVDDLGLGNAKDSKTTGNAGGRMACAIIAHSK